MSDHQATAQTAPDGLWRWLVGGLVGGAAILGLLIAAYVIGYHRGGHHAASSPAATTTNVATTTTPTSSSALGPVEATPALVAQGKGLFTADGCSSCHSLTGSAGVGPSLNSLADSTIALTNGKTVTADDGYLEQSIADPDADIAKGYRAGIMPAAIASYNLNGKPDQIRALVAFIKSEK